MLLLVVSVSVRSLEFLKDGSFLRMVVWRKRSASKPEGNEYSTFLRFVSNQLFTLKVDYA